jgi:hypothetical protein
MSSFPFKWKNGLDCEGINGNPHHNTLDWGCNQRLLVAMKNEAYHLNLKNPQGHLCVTICRPEYKITALKWVLSTTYHSNFETAQKLSKENSILLEDESNENNLIFAAASSDP